MPVGRTLVIQAQVHQAFVGGVGIPLGNTAKVADVTFLLKLHLERNLWTEVFTSPMITVFRVILSVMNGLPLLLAAKKLYLFVTRKGCERNIPQLVLIFEIVANTRKINENASALY